MIGVSLSPPSEITAVSEKPHSRLLRFVQFPSFSRDWRRLGLDDEALRALERELLESPDTPPVIEHTGGLRKMRFSPPGSGRGKRGAYRICFAYFPKFGTIALFVAFGKTERSDLSMDEARAIGQALSRFEEELQKQVDRSARTPKS